jgi:hypothetical protein
MMMLTGRDAPEDVASALNAGANDYVTKPYNDTVLQARLASGKRTVDAVAEATQLARVPPTDDPQAVLQRVLSRDHLIPEFDRRSMRFGFGSLHGALKQWELDGDVQPVVMDRISLCPDCEGLPTFRQGCPACGSARITNEKLLHHFRCGFVATRNDFEQRDALTCPKCLARDMVIGVDFEHVTGPHHCDDCHRSGIELELIGQCITCGLRFPGRQAAVNDLIGYHVERMDLLAHH